MCYTPCPTHPHNLSFKKGLLLLPTRRQPHTQLPALLASLGGGFPRDDLPRGNRKEMCSTYKMNQMGVSKNRGTPKSSIFIWFLVFHYFHHPFWGIPIRYNAIYLFNKWVLFPGGIQSIFFDILIRSYLLIYPPGN